MIDNSCFMNIEQLCLLNQLHQIAPFDSLFLNEKAMSFFPFLCAFEKCDDQSFKESTNFF